MKIVLIDDNKETYEVLNEIALLSQSEIIYFNDIEKVKEFITSDDNSDIDGIVMEKYVSNKPAAAVINYLKEKNLNIPIILLSQDISNEEKEYFLSLGVSEIMEKPFNPLEVMTEIVAILKDKKGEEYVKERLHSEDVDKNALKLIIQKIINIFKKLFFIKWNSSL